MHHTGSKKELNGVIMEALAEAKDGDTLHVHTNGRDIKLTINIMAQNVSEGLKVERSTL